jgi:hypothetical protein
MSASAFPLPSAPPPSAIVGWLNKLVVAAYKLLGFALLAVILIGLVGYIGLHIGYFVHRSWVAPAIIASTDPRVLELRARVSQESFMRQKVAAERAQLQVTLASAERLVRTEEAFQTEFKRAILGDTRARRATLKSLAALEQRFQVAREESAKSGEAVAHVNKELIEEQFRARLIDQHGLLSGNYQLAQINQNNVSLSEREVQLKSEMNQLAREIDALSAVASAEGSAASELPLTYDALSVRRQYEQSLLAAERARDEQRSAKQALEALDKAVAAYDEVLASLKESPFYMALERPMTVAFVPYENVANVRVDTPVYGCDLMLFWCRPVGTLKAYLDGEVKLKHPLYGHEVRGQLAELVVTEPGAAQRVVLHANRPPMLY